MKGFGLSRKFKAPPPPIAVEDKVQEMVPTESFRRTKIREFYETKLKNLARGGTHSPYPDFLNPSPQNGQKADDLARAALMNAMAVQLNAVMNGDIDKKIDNAFIEEFQKWLRGLSAFNADKTKTPWGTKRLVGEDIYAYLSQFVENKFQLESYLAQLKLAPPTNIKDAWLYFKYIVAGLVPDGLDYLPEFNWLTQPTAAQKKTIQDRRQGNVSIKNAQGNVVEQSVSRTGATDAGAIYPLDQDEAPNSLANQLFIDQPVVDQVPVQGPQQAVSEKDELVQEDTQDMVTGEEGAKEEAGEFKKHLIHKDMSQEEREKILRNWWHIPKALRQIRKDLEKMNASLEDKNMVYRRIQYLETGFLDLPEGELRDELAAVWFNAELLNNWANENEMRLPDQFGQKIEHRLKQLIDDENVFVKTFEEAAEKNDVDLLKKLALEVDPTSMGYGLIRTKIQQISNPLPKTEEQIKSEAAEFYLANALNFDARAGADVAVHHKYLENAKMFTKKLILEFTQNPTQDSEYNIKKVMSYWFQRLDTATSPIQEDVKDAVLELSMDWGHNVASYLEKGDKSAKEDAKQIREIAEVIRHLKAEKNYPPPDQMRKSFERYFTYMKLHSKK